MNSFPPLLYIFIYKLRHRAKLKSSKAALMDRADDENSCFRNWQLGFL